MIQVEDALRKLEERRATTLTHLEKMLMYHQYLEAVLERATQFHEIHDLMLRSPFRTMNLHYLVN